MESASPTIFCTRCNKRFCFDNQLRQHLATTHFGGEIPARPVEELNQPIVGQTPYQELAAYEQVLDEHADIIKSDETNKTLWKRVNREIKPNFSYANLKSLLEEVMSKEVSAFKINLGFGVIL